jgi:hypothetical protein
VRPRARGVLRALQPLRHAYPTAEHSLSRWVTGRARGGLRPRGDKGDRPKKKIKKEARRHLAALSGGWVRVHLYCSANHLAVAELGVAVMHQRRLFCACSQTAHDPRHAESIFGGVVVSIFEISRQEFDDLNSSASSPSTWPGETECAWLTDTASAVLGIVLCEPAQRRWSYVLFVREANDRVREIERRDGLLSEGAAKRDLMLAMRVCDRSPIPSSWGSG